VIATKGRKLTTFDDVRPGDLLRLEPDAGGSCLILFIDPHNKNATVTWMLVFDTPKKKEKFMFDHGSIIYQGQWNIREDFDFGYKEDYWVKL
jgi:hypothetical protein